METERKIGETAQDLCAREGRGFPWKVRLFLNQKGKMKIEQLISVDEKKAFLKWFMSHYELKTKDYIWLLNYIMDDELLIGLLRFVESIEHCPRAILITDRDRDRPSFFYRKGRVETREPEKAFHDVRLYQDDPIYVQLDFREIHHSIPYLSILEDNPFLDGEINQRYGDIAGNILHSAEHRFHLEKLNSRIDKAIEDGDKQAFLELTSQLKQILEKQPYEN